MIIKLHLQFEKYWCKESTYKEYQQCMAQEYNVYICESSVLFMLSNVKYFYAWM